MKRLCLSIFFCLCTLYSVEAQDSLRLKALQCEREYYSLESASEAEAALLRKAECLVALGDTLAAESTLKRINLYMLDAQSQQRSDSLLLSLQKLPEEKGKKHSGVWAFVPPVGHIMAGEPGRGVLMTIADAGALAFGIWQAISGNWITAYLIGAVSLSHSYFEEGMRIVPEITD